MSALMDALEITNIDELPPEANWLEGDRGFDRWAIGPEDSLWFCSVCGAVVDDIDDGCRSCGRGIVVDLDEFDD